MAAGVESFVFTSTTGVFGDALAPPAGTPAAWVTIGRVYVNDRARNKLGWQPRYDFSHIINCLRAGDDVRSPLAQVIGSKGYHAKVFSDGPYPVE